MPADDLESLLGTFGSIDLPKLGRLLAPFTDDELSSAAKSIAEERDVLDEGIADFLACSGATVMAQVCWPSDASYSL